MTGDLLELARPRALLTRELHPYNAFYGHAAILRRHAGLTGSRPLKAALEHGPTLFENLDDPDLGTWLPRYFCAAPGQARFYDEHARHGARAVAIGAPILYARALAPPPPPAVPSRLVFFDAHSSHFATSSYDIAATVARLEALRETWAEVVVCLYWRDVLLGRAAAYGAHGFECVTAGHMFDPAFLFRLIEIVSSATAVLTNRLGSHLLYSVVLDRPAWLEPAEVDYSLALDAPAGTTGPPPQARVAARVREVFGSPVALVTAEQRELADELCGVGSFRPSSELHGLLAEAEIEYASSVPWIVRRRLEAAATARLARNAAVTVASLRRRGSKERR